MRCAGMAQSTRVHSKSNELVTVVASVPDGTFTTTGIGPVLLLELAETSGCGRGVGEIALSVWEGSDHSASNQGPSVLEAL